MDFWADTCFSRTYVSMVFHPAVNWGDYFIEMDLILDVGDANFGGHIVFCGNCIHSIMLEEEKSSIGFSRSKCTPNIVKKWLAFTGALRIPTEHRQYNHSTTYHGWPHTSEEINPLQKVMHWSAMINRLTTTLTYWCLTIKILPESKLHFRFLTTSFLQSQYLKWILQLQWLTFTN